MDIWLPRYGFPLFLHSDQGKEFDNTMILKLSELLGTVKTKTTPYHLRRDGLVECFNRTLLAMLAMFVSREHDNWDDLLPFMMLAYNTTVHTTTGYTPYRLVFGEKCNLPGNLVHRELRPDPPPGDPGTYASWVQQALHESYDEVRAQQQRATHKGPHTKGVLDKQKEPILRHREHFVAKSLSNRVARTTSGTKVPVRHNFQ